MLIYNFNDRGDRSLYEHLYRCLRDDIISGKIPAGSRLPSKRGMAADNGVSVRTVMNAYEQLLTEGYLTSQEKRGYFAACVDAGEPFRPRRQRGHAPDTHTAAPSPGSGSENWFADFTSNTAIYEKFPFSLWSRTMRQVLSSYSLELIERAHFLGVPALRAAIADYLGRTRGMDVSPDCIVIGASIEYLYGKLIRLLPKEAVYAAENPGYRKIPRIFDEFGLAHKSVEMDGNGISLESLAASGASVVHVSPEHHYPLGTVMSAARRRELLSWAAEKPDRYIIEDDYDCEFRYQARSIPALQGMDRHHRVIYMNTFSKTMAPAIRISYMVLPEKLARLYVDNANFYSNSASSCEQYALAHFIEDGSFERHLSRLKKYYRQQGERLLRILKQNTLIPIAKLRGGSCGTHLLLRADTSLTDVEIKWAARCRGILLSCLSEFCSEVRPEYEHVLVLNYSSLDERTLQETVRRLASIFVQW